MTSTSDVVVKHIANFCAKCGDNLPSISERLSQRRQVIDIPSIPIITTEHRTFLKTYTCGHNNIDDWSSFIRHEK